jgi:hypothetical protein
MMTGSTVTGIFIGGDTVTVPDVLVWPFWDGWDAGVDEEGVETGEVGIVGVTGTVGVVGWLTVFSRTHFPSTLTNPATQTHFSPIKLEPIGQKQNPNMLWKVGKHTQLPFFTSI